MRAGSRPLPAMLEEITAGVRYLDFAKVSEIILAPTFWGAPLMFWESIDNFRLLVLFGARPGSMSLIAGDIVPDGLMRGLKAMADPTRLRIFRYLANAPQNAEDIALFFRLRLPTINHHLSQLRLAGLLQVFLDSNGVKMYAARFEGFNETQDLLNRFVHGE